MICAVCSQPDHASISFSPDCRFETDYIGIIFPFTFYTKFENVSILSKPLPSRSQAHLAPAPIHSRARAARRAGTPSVPLPRRTTTSSSLLASSVHCPHALWHSNTPALRHSRTQRRAALLAALRPLRQRPWRLTGALRRPAPSARRRMGTGTRRCRKGGLSPGAAAAPDRRDVIARRSVTSHAGCAGAERSLAFEVCEASDVRTACAMSAG